MKRKQTLKSNRSLHKLTKKDLHWLLIGNWAFHYKSFYAFIPKQNFLVTHLCFSLFKLQFPPQSHLMTLSLSHESINLREKVGGNCHLILLSDFYIKTLSQYYNLTIKFRNCLKISIFFFSFLNRQKQILHIKSIQFPSKYLKKWGNEKKKFLPILVKVFFF